MKHPRTIVHTAANHTERTMPWRLACVEAAATKTAAKTTRKLSTLFPSARPSLSAFGPPAETGCSNAQQMQRVTVHAGA